MLVALALAASVPQPVIKVSDLLRNAFQIPHDLYYLAETPSGISFCNKALARRQTRAFDKRYGARFNRLVEVVKSSKGLGWPPDQMIVMSCHRRTEADAKRLLNEFEEDLSTYERRYGLAKEVR